VKAILYFTEKTGLSIFYNCSNFD